MKLLKKEEDTVRKREVEAILFDLDGVLVDSLDAWFYVFNDTLKSFRLRTLSKEEFAKYFGAPIESDMKRYFIGKTIKEVITQHNKNFKRRKNLVKLFPDSTKTLQNLKNKKIKLGLLSNSTKFIVTTILNHFKIKKYFKVIITLEDVKRRKPAPDMILKACRMLKVTPKNTILVGDTKNDMIAGRRAKCVTVGYKINGDNRIDKLHSITRFLNQNPNRT